MAETAEAVTPPNRSYFPLAIIHEHPKNPRKTFNDQSLRELAQTFGGRPEGIRQDLLLRPHPTIEGEYEIVIGHRRSRAAKLAGLDVVPARVENLSDIEVREIQLVENGQREDVHPIEEAETIEAMRVELGLTYAQIAERLGKSENLIFRRLKLLGLTEKGREAYRAGLLTEASAFLLARVPKVLQDRACVAITTQRVGWDPKKREDLYGPVEQPKPASEVADFLARKFMLPLTPVSKLPFDPKDASLVEGVPSCGDCPKRTGNAKDLFGDVEGEDVCTDIPCYESKALATFRAEAKVAAEKGWTVIEEPEKAREFFPYDHGQLRGEVSGKFYDLRDQCHAFDKPITFGDLLKKAEKAKKDATPIRRTLVLSPWTGHGIEIVEKSLFDAFVADAGLIKKTAKGGVTAAKKEDRKKDPERERQQKEAAERKIRRGVVDRLMTQGIATILGGNELSEQNIDDLYRGAIEAMLVGNRNGATLGFIVARKPVDKAALETDGYSLNEKFLKTTLPKLKGDDLVLAVWSAIMLAKDPYSDYPNTVQYAVAAIDGLNLTDVEKGIRAEAEERTTKAKKATAEGTAKKSPKSEKKQARKAAVKKEVAKRPAKPAPAKKTPARKAKGK